MQENLMPGLKNLSLVVEDVAKSYGSTPALRGLSLTAQPDQVIGIVGPNGAGKSTLVRILAGEETEDTGIISLGGAPLGGEMRRRLVAVVHQEPQLFPNLTVVENLMIDRHGVARPKPTAQVTELLERMQLTAFARAPLENSSIMVWQLTEIARALLRSAEVFLFDEPNSALTKEESERLFQHMGSLQAAGKIVFLVSHRLGEVAEICGQVLVVRDGTVVSTLSGDALTSDRLASLLIAEEFGTGDTAKEPGQEPGPAHDGPGEASIAASGGPANDLNANPAPASTVAGPPAVVHAEPGVVVAVTGPEGGGGRELARMAALHGGADDRRGGRGGRAYVPADRRHSLFFNMSVAANISARLERAQLPGHKRFTNRRVLAQAAASYIEGFTIKTEHPGASVGSLSGGNQQKVALASALAVQPELLVIEEPTRGVDVRTKLQIYEILRQFASSGGAVVMFVNELEDALGCADCLYVVNDGAVRGRIEVGRTDDLEALGLEVNRFLSRDGANAA
jgi:ABC-type sugar transport system ATPase subunit